MSRDLLVIVTIKNNALLTADLPPESSLNLT
jgi:hypothetical protein